MYEYTQSAWHKTGMEGSLFVAQHIGGSSGTTPSTATPSYYELILLNRHAVDNFRLTLTADLQLQHQEPYLIFKIVEPQGVRIRGIWFHSAQERVWVYNALQQVLQTLQQLQMQQLQQPPPSAMVLSAFAARSQSAPPLERLEPVSRIIGDTPTAAATTALTPSSSLLPPDSDAAASSPTMGSNGGGSDTFGIENMALGASGNALVQTLAAAAASASPGNVDDSNGASLPAALQPTEANTNAAASGSAGSSNSSSNQGVALDKKSLQLALLSLLQDDRFLELLHSQYLRVVHARAKKQPPPSSSS